ncbi:uncharacterized protein L969DRAFT_103006 [Mixia osmundae IAM 14324]|uniref:ADP-ribosylation factor-like protein 8B n=1 Tax=Mixia osmundae (strain CBS 9802 / IAM 14324 / JCM 22182 / KY 12970) TaxID=764103 RepID=G7E2R9_MIXOS|nr:uncharacterized protein L969DRAFT_103006 [Mixia osmundae IAM 14324]KEI40320.1 hypothetical protein L969DRAFT_103006 [Mixia osmundae IAM 14324]GAA97129.1 hypothetical protein E5Q_03804 [Mixia osmundae IAM 14324]
MSSVFKMVLDWLRGLLFSKELEMTIVGLQNSGKTSLVNALSNGQFSESVVPTVGFNVKKVTKGKVTMRLWDIGGQPRFRSMWERYCRGVNAILFIIDSADHEKLDSAKEELLTLLERPQLASIPVLVLGNKNDLPSALKVADLIDRLELAKIANREVSCYSISCQNQNNIDITMNWLTKRA